jgi:outer membrane autotransporter protein
MRILLATAVAIAPLMAATGALAEVVISTARTTPITTSNATGSAADAIRIASGGSIKLASGAAVTLDSSHGVDIDSGGAITMEQAANGATGILANGGNTGSIIVGGTISISDDITNTTDVDADDDGDADGQFAHGTGRYGVRVAGAAPLVGNITIETSGAIGVEGNSSYGLSLEAPLTGTLLSQGTFVVTGDDNYGIRTTGTISGDLKLAGSVTTRGGNSTGVSIEGDVAGAALIQSNIISTGYRHTERPPTRPEGYEETADNDDHNLFLDELDADDLLQGGPALSISASVGQGLLFDSKPEYGGDVDGDEDKDGVKNGDEDDDGDGKINREDTDRDGDGFVDANEATSNILSFGSAPAVRIGAATRSITLGAVGAGDEAYGLINRGTISGQGVYDGVNANGLVIDGGAGQTVQIDGGIFNSGVMTANAVRADATAVRLGAGVSADVFRNDGTISANAATDTTSVVTAIDIAAGADVPSLVNEAAIQATAGGGKATVVALRDRSGSLSSIYNSGAIQAGLTANADHDPITGTTVAIDVSANTTGVTLTQVGKVVAGSTGTDTDGDGIPNSREPAIIGSIALGSGADFVDIQNGTVTGDIAFGDGADRLSISGGGVVRGALSDLDDDLSIDVSNGVLDARQDGTMTVSDLTVGSEGSLIMTIDPANGAGGFNVTGTATLADGAGLGVRFNSLLATAGRFTLIDAGTLDAGAVNLDAVQENSPYLYVVDAGIDAANNQVFADIRQRTAAEAGMITVEGQMYDAFYQAIGGTGAEDVRNAFLAQTNREDFFDLYEQLLPDHSGGPLLSLSSGVDAVTRALTGRNASAEPGETSAWVQEINFYADKDKTDSYGFRSEGFGVAGGVETGTDLGAVGVSLAFTSSDLEDPEAEAEEVLSASLLELGIYWRAQGQYWTTWARAAAGYAWFNSERSFVGGGLNLSNESDWNGVSLTAAGGVSYERSYGRFTIRPEAYVEYFGLSEDGHVETGGGDGFDLDIDDREGHMFSATAAINVAMSMGDNSWVKPEFRFGWRQNISVDPGETIARFASGGPDFTLTPGSIEGGGPLVGLRLNVGNELGMLTLSADAEMIEDYVRYMIFMRASFRF